MGHTVQAFIAKPDIFRNATPQVQGIHLIPIEQGLVLLLNTDLLYNEISKGSTEEPPYQEFYKLSLELAKFGAECSVHGLVAYVETDYFGGHGTQAALLWEHGAIVYDPTAAKIGPINTALRRMGVERRQSLDEFEAVGLARHRSNDDWIER